MKTFSIGEAASILGVTTGTLRRWDKEQSFKPDFRTAGNHRRYTEKSVAGFIGNSEDSASIASEERKIVLYSRVSSSKQIKLLKAVMSGNISTVVVAHKDRLLRFGTAMFESVCEFHGTRVIYVDNLLASLSPQEELVQDLIAICTVFSCKTNGMRSAKNRAKKAA